MDDSMQEAQPKEPPRKRRRAKVACEPCRERKRRCDGRYPCSTCTEFEYECRYLSDTQSPRKRPELANSLGGKQNSQSKGNDASSWSVDSVNTQAPTKSTYELETEPLANSQQARETSNAVGREKVQAHLQSLEANSGAAFVRKLGLKIDPNNAPRLRLFAWNTGERLSGCPPGSARSILTLLSRTQMVNLSKVYFEKVGCIYGFINEDNFYERLNTRWTAGVTIDHYDQVFCGVAALGLFFSQPMPAAVEADLAESARDSLERHSLESPPSFDTVAGWILRVAYLRVTSTPHATWLASCTMMHVIEAAGIHQETPSHTIFDESREAIDLDTRRRLWGNALHLNIWASFDLGRMRVTLPNASTKLEPIKPQEGNKTSQMFAFVSLSDVLDPSQTRSIHELESDLSTLLTQSYDAAPVTMAHTNLVLCLFRRLMSQKPTAVIPYTERILIVANKALRAAEFMVTYHHPWHHAANIPFQIICLLLAIDSRASIAMLQDAMSVLRRVRDAWSTAVMQEACDTAYLLVLLHQRRKEQDARDLRGVLDMHSPPVVPGNSDGNVISGLQDALGDESLWLDDLFSTVPGLREFDIEQFLVHDASHPQQF